MVAVAVTIKIQPSHMQSWAQNYFVTCYHNLFWKVRVRTWFSTFKVARYSPARYSTDRSTPYLVAGDKIAPADESHVEMVGAPVGILQQTAGRALTHHSHFPHSEKSLVCSVADAGWARTRPAACWRVCQGPSSSRLQANPGPALALPSP
jgi:hypothetical protein